MGIDMDRPTWRGRQQPCGQWRGRHLKKIAGQQKRCGDRARDRITNRPCGSGHGRSCWTSWRGTFCRCARKGSGIATWDVCRTKVWACTRQHQQHHLGFARTDILLSKQDHKPWKTTGEDAGWPEGHRELFMPLGHRCCYL